MSSRIAGGLAVAAMLMSVAAVIVAAVTLTRDAPESPEVADLQEELSRLRTQAMVRDAIQRYDRIGLEASIEYHNNPENVDGQWYAFIINSEGYTIAHHKPDIRGRDPSLRVDSTGRFYGGDLLGATENGRWVDYYFVNPETGEDTQKHTWAVKHDGFLFGSGWYNR